MKAVVVTMKGESEEEEEEAEKQAGGRKGCCVLAPAQLLRACRCVALSKGRHSTRRIPNKGREVTGKVRAAKKEGAGCAESLPGSLGAWGKRDWEFAVWRLASGFGEVRWGGWDQPISCTLELALIGDSIPGARGQWCACGGRVAKNQGQG